MDIHVAFVVRVSNYPENGLIVQVGIYFAAYIYSPPQNWIRKKQGKGSVGNAPGWILDATVL